MKSQNSIFRSLAAGHSRRILANTVLISGAAAALLLSFLLSSCSRTVPDHHTGELVPVEVAVFDAGTLGADVVLPARVKAAEEVTLATRLGARLTALHAREGDRVRRGDVIGEFGAPEMKRALAAARADLASAEAQLAVSARQEARMESLFAARVVSERDREVAAAERRSDEAQLESARAALDALESGINVRAPFDGVVVRLHADPGADLAPGAPLADLRSSAGLEVVADVPEAAAARISTSELSVQIGDGPWRPARLARLDGMTDWRSRSRTAHLTFDGDAEPGAYARVALATQAKATGDGSVPLSSLVTRGALSGVFVVEDQHARLRWLKLGRTRGDRVEVLAGLEAGEPFALAPQPLSDGVPVKVLQ
jgi:RND family efflux transporter MFP subunit